MQTLLAIAGFCDLIASIPGLMYKGIRMLCQGIYWLFTQPCILFYTYIYLPIWGVCCRPGFLCYQCKEGCVTCCERCRVCCCPTHADSGSYGAGV